MLELSREKSDDCVLLCGMLYVHNSSDEPENSDFGLEFGCFMEE